MQTCEAECPWTREKARKTPAELRGLLAAHQRDGTAMVEFLCWLDQAASVPSASIAESDLADKLLAFRQQQDGFLAPSFNTISGSGPNGAIVHYRAIAGADRELASDDLLLLDSGGHYRDGTTDITLTIAMGTPPKGAVAASIPVLQRPLPLDLATVPTGAHVQQL